MNFVEFSKINNLSGKMVDAVKHFCDEILKINPESLTYSESASESTFMNVFTSRIDLLKKMRESPVSKFYANGGSAFSIIITPDFPYDYKNFDLKTFDYEFEHIDEGKMKMASPDEMIGIITMTTCLDFVSPEAMNWMFWHEAGHIIARDPFRFAESDSDFDIENRADDFATIMTRGEYKIAYEDFYNDLYYQCRKLCYKNKNPKATKLEIKKMMDTLHNDSFLCDRILAQHAYAKHIKELYRKQEK